MTVAVMLDGVADVGDDRTELRAQEDQGDDRDDDNENEDECVLDKTLAAIVVEEK